MASTKSGSGGSSRPRAQGGTARGSRSPAPARAGRGLPPKATVTPAAPAPALPEPAPAVSAIAEAAPSAMEAPAPPAPARAPEPVQEDRQMNAETVIKTVEQASEAVEKVAKDAMAQGQASLDQMNAKAGELMEQASKSISEMTEFTKGNMEAMIASAKAATTGAEVLAKELAEQAKARFEATSSAWRTMMAAKTPNELFQFQNDFMKQQVDASIAAMSHMTEVMLKVAGEVTQPLSNRMAVAAEHVKKAMEAR